MSNQFEQYFPSDWYSFTRLQANECGSFDIACFVDTL